MNSLHNLNLLILFQTSSTFVCPTELIAFSERMSEFRALNCEVVGVSTDSHFSHLAWNNMSKKVINFWCTLKYTCNLNAILSFLMIHNLMHFLLPFYCINIISWHITIVICVFWLSQTARWFRRIAVSFVIRLQQNNLKRLWCFIGRWRHCIEGAFPYQPWGMWCVEYCSQCFRYWMLLFHEIVF